MVKGLWLMVLFDRTGWRMRIAMLRWRDKPTLRYKLCNYWMSDVHYFLNRFLTSLSFSPSPHSWTTNSSKRNCCAIGWKSKRRLRPPRRLHLGCPKSWKEGLLLLCMPRLWRLSRHFWFKQKSDLEWQLQLVKFSHVNMYKETQWN